MARLDRWSDEHWLEKLMNGYQAGCLYRKPLRNPWLSIIDLTLTEVKDASRQLPKSIHARVGPTRRFPIPTTPDKSSDAARVKYKLRDHAGGIRIAHQRQRAIV